MTSRSSATMTGPRTSDALPARRRARSAPAVAAGARARRRREDRAVSGAGVRHRVARSERRPWRGGPVAGETIGEVGQLRGPGCGFERPRGRVEFRQPAAGARAGLLCIDHVHRFDQTRLERGGAPALPTVGQRFSERWRRVARRLERDERAEHLAVEVVGDAIGRGPQAAAHPLARRDGDLAHPVELERVRITRSTVIAAVATTSVGDPSGDLQRDRAFIASLRSSRSV